MRTKNANKVGLHNGTTFQQIGKSHWDPSGAQTQKFTPGKPTGQLQQSLLSESAGGGEPSQSSDEGSAALNPTTLVQAVVQNQTIENVLIEPRQLMSATGLVPILQSVTPSNQREAGAVLAADGQLISAPGEGIGEVVTNASVAKAAQSHLLDVVGPRDGGTLVALSSTVEKVSKRPSDRTASAASATKTEIVAVDVVQNKSDDLKVPRVVSDAIPAPLTTKERNSTGSEKKPVLRVGTNNLVSKSQPGAFSVIATAAVPVIGLASAIDEATNFEPFELAAASQLAATSSEGRPAVSNLAPETARLKAPVSEVSRAVLDQIRSHQVREGRTVITLSPQGLGVMEVDITTNVDGHVQVVLRVENAQVLSLLRDDRDFVHQTLSQFTSHEKPINLDFQNFRERSDDPVKEARDEKSEMQDPSAPEDENVEGHDDILNRNQVDILT
jgi:hypothetical protein